MANSEKIRKNFDKEKLALLSMVLISVVFLAVFAYAPMFGVVLAFKDGDYELNILDAILESPWTGFANFNAFFKDPNFLRVIRNTLCINLLMLVINFPMPILFALLINEVRQKFFRKTVQTLANFPHFISWVIFGGIVIALCDPGYGIVNPILKVFGLASEDNPVDLMDAGHFWGTVIVSSVIKGTGWGSIVYLAAISGIDTEQYEAATIDGANRFQKAIYITLPSIAPTITVFLLLNISHLLNNSFDQFYSMQSVNNYEMSDVIATYVYKTGISQRRYSYTSALGLFNSLISFFLLVTANYFSKKFTDRGLF